jgi:hypothetical protein
MRANLCPNPVLYLERGEFMSGFDWLVKRLSTTMVYQRGRVHAQDVSDRPEFGVHELHNVLLTYDAPTDAKAAARLTGANLPWAEDHFQERVSGEPLNPSPSEAWWPFKVQGNAAHKDGQIFSHTYPERMWPKLAGDPDIEKEEGFYNDSGRRIPAYGIRYNYGDLNDVVHLLARDPFTRQAFLPIWFPEDTGSVDGQRVPCSLGYHFIRRGTSLDCQYFMRSCDVFRHFQDDVYMAIRLLQWMCDRLQDREFWNDVVPHDDGPYPFVGEMTLFISNLHCFKGDEYRFKS